MSRAARGAWLVVVVLALDGCTGLRATFRGSDPSILNIAVSASGVAVTTDAEGRVMTWDLTSAPDATPGSIIFQHDPPARALALSPSGLLGVAGADGGVVSFWTTRGGSVTTLRTGSASPITCVAMDDSGRVVAGDAHGTIHLWEGPGDPEVATDAVDAPIACMQLQPDGAVVIATLDGRTASLPRHGALDLRRLDVPGAERATDVAMSRSGSVVAYSYHTLNLQPSVEFWHRETGRPLAGLASGSAVARIVFVGDEDPTLLQYNLDSNHPVSLWSTTGELVRTCEMRPLRKERATCLAGTPDRRTALVGTSAGRLLVLELRLPE